VLLAVRAACTRHVSTLRVATFNIEEFPQNARQIDGAFRELAATAAPIVAVQEIMDPPRFAHELHARLGDAWDFVHTDTGGFDLGVAFDRRAWRFVAMQIHDETCLGGNHKPVLDVRLRAGDEIVRVLVVHLKSGTAGRDVRARQYGALVRIVRDAARSGDRIVVMGDFNATEDGDRDDLARLARATGLAWATESLACSAFWSRDDGCPRSRLDHVLTSSPPRAVTAAGACATDGCEWRQSCPLYVDEISDHCPVVVDL
jgi:endonuclease/exonuclease/phosphatase family metal-dependent hydrolase